MIAAGADVEDGVEGSRLTGGGQHGGSTAFQSGDAGGDGIVCGVLEPGVEIAGGFQIEELAHVFAGVIFEGGALNNRDLAGFAVFRGIACMEAFGFQFHRVTHFPVFVFSITQNPRRNKTSGESFVYLM